MQGSRRNFLTGAGTMLAAAAASQLPLPAAAQPAKDSWLSSRPQAEYVSQALWTPATFQPFVNSNFRVTDGKQSLQLKLLRVQDIRQQNVGSSTAFSLHFQLASGTHPFPQGTYEFSNPQLGKFLLFVVTSDKGAHARYVAVINRL